MENTYSIPTFKMETFNKKINAMINKAIKLDLPPYKVEVLGTEIVEVETGKYDEDKKAITMPIEYTNVKVEGEAPTLNGYELLAMLESEEGGTLVKRFKNETESIVPIEKLHELDSNICHHCGTRRYRKSNFVLLAENGELFQVGKSCLKDFTNGHYSATSIANHYSMTDVLRELEEVTEEEFLSYGYSISYSKTVEMVALSIHFTDKYGYQSKQGFGESTMSKIADYKYNKRSKMFDENPSLDEILAMNEEKAKDVIEYYKNVVSNNDYLHNLKVLLSGEHFKSKNAGYVVSAYSSYNKAMGIIQEKKILEEQKKVERATSQYVGVVGERKEYTLKFDREVSYETMFGTSYMYFFYDEQDNVFMWGTNKSLDFEKGQTVSLVGTLKEHKEYREVKQNVLTRCKIK